MKLLLMLATLIALAITASYASGQGVRKGERRPTAVIILEPDTVAKPAPAAAPEPANGINNNFGINLAKVGVAKDAYTANTPAAARFVISANEPGKSDSKSHVTVIGDDDERARVINDIATNPAFASVRDSLLVQDYNPGDWAVDPALGFRPGKPAIYVQSPKGPHDPKGGRVIWRQLDYSGGPEGLAKAIIEAKRKADPDYKPDKDPSPPRPVPLIGDESTPFYVCGALLVLALVVFFPKKGS